MRARFPLSQRRHEHYASARRLSCPAKRGRGTVLRSRTVEGASAAPLALDAPSTAQTRRPPPPLRFTTRGRISERIPATRSAPGFCEKCRVGSLRSSVTHHAERWVSLRSTHPTKRNDERKKGSGTPTDVFSQPPHPHLHPPRMRDRGGAAHALVSFPSPACGGGLGRGHARLSAFHRGSCCSERTPQLSSRYALPGTWSDAAIPKLRTTGFEKPCAFSAHDPEEACPRT